MSDEDQEPSAPETPLQIATRRVAEGKARIARQEKLIVELKPDRHDYLLSQANAFLLELWKFQAIVEEHLACELATEDGSPGAIAALAISEEAPMTLLIVAVVLLVIAGGGGYYGYNQDYYGGRSYGGGLFILLVLLIMLYFVFGNGTHSGAHIIPLG